MSISAPHSSSSTANSELEAPHGVRIYLPPALFAYLVEQAERDGESLSSMIIEVLYKDYDLHAADPSWFLFQHLRNGSGVRHLRH